MLSLLLAAALAQAPDARAPVAIVITSKRPGAEAVSQQIAAHVLQAFKREGVAKLMDDATASKELEAAGFSDPKTCQGSKSCLSKLAILLGPKAVVVGVDVGKVAKTLAIHLEAVAADQEAALAALDVSSSFDGWSNAMSAPIVVFVRDVKKGLELKRASPPPPPPPPLVVATKNDAPVKTELAPAPKEPAVELVEPAHPKRSRAVPWALTGGAVAAAGAGVAFAVMGFGEKAKFDAALVSLPDGTRGTTLSENDANALAGSANTKFAVAITSAIVSAGLAGAATYFFVKD